MSYCWDTGQSFINDFQKILGRDKINMGKVTYNFKFLSHLYKSHIVGKMENIVIVLVVPRVSSLIPERERVLTTN